ncbi:MAG TPA: aminotransferase class I/II-fold pyridoxal phosphate-dependent enzyme [Chloroflexota bacterium]|nr:aminotransferase class I/II-fold pyridoxal phosphate-dependent enzyme [Chloroflexota bacterium]
MQIPIFELERFQSLYEHSVDFNLSESGVHPLTTRELAQGDDLSWLLDVRLGYTQTNGPVQLRERIAELYPSANLENVLVTTGTIEANFLCTWRLLAPGDELVYMLPNYVQIGGIAETLGVEVKPFYLQESAGWQPDLAALERLITPRTKMIAVCNPNNPTGALLSRESRSKIIALAEKANAWLLVDEIYRGAEHSGKLTESFFGSYERTIVTGGLSKAFGLPGLRIGWVLGPPDLVESLWAAKDYSSITAATLSYELATYALEPAKRAWLMKRNLGITANNLRVLQTWIADHDGLLSLAPPKAGAMAFVRYRLELPSLELADKLHREKSVLVVPGEHCDMDNFLRLGYGLEQAAFTEALGRLSDTFHSLQTA